MALTSSDFKPEDLYQHPPEPRSPIFIGADVRPDGVFFRLWAPARKKIAIILGEEKTNEHPLSAEEGGYFSGTIAEAKAGDFYRIKLDDDERLYYDPASRWQPNGPHGPSRIVNKAQFKWTDHDWHGVPVDEQILYEMHIGTFTAEGTWRSAAAELTELAKIGITTIEMMPVAEFPGRFGWGYDGVNMFAPSHLYGTPEDLKFFIDTAHANGVAVILDVVYNHFGPDGNFMSAFSEDYFTDRYKNDWGKAINFDGPNAGPVRDYFLANARYWIEEFHFDGLRLDATQNIDDASDRHILADIVSAAKSVAGNRTLFFVGENESQNTRLIHKQEHGGYGMDALWNDDFHHSAVVAMTGRKEAYYQDYLGAAQEFISLAKRGFLYQGQWYDWQMQRRGTPTKGLGPQNFVTFIENHDQIANSGRGYRIYTQTSPGRHRAMTAVLFLMPQMPMLFQGQEFGSSRSFYYFADHSQELAAKVNEGRKEFLAQFPSLGTAEMRDLVPDPANPDTFVHSRLDLNERHLHSRIYQLHKDLIGLRKRDRTFSHPPYGFDGAVLSPESFVMRFFGENDDDRLLIVNLGRDLHFSPSPEPLLAPPLGKSWDILWSSEDPIYGGQGTAQPDSPLNWRVAGHSAVVMTPGPKRNDPKPPASTPEHRHG